MGAGIGKTYKKVRFTIPYKTWGYDKPYNAPINDPNQEPNR